MMSEIERLNWAKLTSAQKKARNNDAGYWRISAQRNRNERDEARRELQVAKAELNATKQELRRLKTRFAHIVLRLRSK